MIVVAGYVFASEANRAEMLRIVLERRSRLEPGCIEHGVYADAGSGATAGTDCGPSGRRSSGRAACLP